MQIIDGFTKFDKLYPVNSTSTKDVLACLNKYFEYFSRPRRIITDQASCFTSFEFANKLKDWNIEHVKIAVGSPQANGQVERMNRTIKSLLSKVTEPLNHADWVQKLSDVESAVNNCKQSTTGYSPSELLFGVKQRTKVPDELSEFIESNFHKHSSPNLHDIRDNALHAIEKTQLYSESRAALKNTPPKVYKEGDFVVIRNIDVSIGTNKKFAPNFKGPYVIHKVLSNDRYVVRDIENCQLTQRPYDNIIEAARMRKWVENTG